MTTHRASSLLLMPLLILAAAAPRAEPDLTDLDLVTLMNMDVKVTSAAKREQTSSDAPAAVYVITRDDIRRSGATSLPEVLRMAPGVQVSRINTRSWAVTVRGFNGRFASKLLVMVDGRNIYTPLFSGVIWEEQSVFLDEIERIEVVRGPGGALWGINAVNGVINIITRKANESAGLRASAGSGSMLDRSGSVSYGGSFEGVGDYRFYVDHNRIDSLEPNGAPRTNTQFGWRLDRELANGDFTFQGDINDAELGRVAHEMAVELAMTATVGNVAASWHRDLAPGRVELRSYYAWAERGLPSAWDDSALGLDAQFNAERIGRHLFTAGIGYRHTTDEMNAPSVPLTLDPQKLDQHQWGLYAQDEVHFFDDAVRVTLGAKLEDLKFTGLAFQPTLRGLWRVNEAHTVWAAASRAVRTPSRVELHAQMEVGHDSLGGPIVRVLGDPALAAEDLRAYELGWRWRPMQQLSFDLALYRNDYEELVGAVPLPPVMEFDPAPLLILPAAFVNAGRTRIDGVELVAEWAATDRLRLLAQGSWQDSEADNFGIFPGPIDPARMFLVRAQIDLRRNVDLDLSWRSVSDMPGLNLGGHKSVDARVAWQPVSSLEFSLSVENLMNDERVEHNDDLAMGPGVTLGRSFFGRFVWRPR